MGDCDDQTILMCSALRGVKIPMRMVFLGWKKPDHNTKPIPLKHIYSEGYLDDAWVPLETVKKVHFGFDPARWKMEQGNRVRVVRYGDPTPKT